MKTYTIRYECGIEVKIERKDLASAVAHAEKTACDGFVPGNTTHWHSYSVLDEDGDEPECPGDFAHKWRQPYDLVGGLRESPGVHSHGGGVICTYVCMHCGCERVEDSWAQDPSDGSQGLESVQYTPDKYKAEIQNTGDEA
jgi:hypothetical protein